MTHSTDTASRGYLGHKRAEMIGYWANAAWVSLFGGVSRLPSDELSDWVPIAIGVGVALVPLTPWFRRYWAEEGPYPIFPWVALIGNVVLIILYGSILQQFLADEFLFYNDADAGNVSLYGVSMGIMALTLIAGVLAGYVGRRRLMRAS